MFAKKTGMALAALAVAVSASAATAQEAATSDALIAFPGSDGPMVRETDGLRRGVAYDGGHVGCGVLAGQ